MRLALAVPTIPASKFEFFRKFASFPHWALPALLMAVLLGNLAYIRWACPFDLAPDEAHYWDWARNLDWCYYSKGPLVALLIRASCTLLGDTAFAVRLPAAVCGTALLGGMAKLAFQITGNRRFAFLVAAAALTLPGLSAASVMMTIDAPFLACWVWAAVCVQAALHHPQKSMPLWCAAGALVAVGLLAKLTMLFFPLGVALLMLQQQRHRTRRAIPFALIAALGLLPTIIWNIGSDGIGLLHTLGHTGHQDDRPGLIGPIAFLGGQFGLLLGIWFIAWLRALWTLRPISHPATALLWWLSVPLFATCTVASIGTFGQPNWPAAAFVGGFVLAMIWVRAQWDRLAIRRAVLIAIVFGIGSTILLRWPGLIRPGLAELTGQPSHERPAPVRRLDPTARLLGWSELAAEVDLLRKRVCDETGEEPLLAGMTWTIPGELGFYCEGHPQVYTFGLGLADRFSQYDLWRPNPVLDAQGFRGRTFVYVGEALPTEAFERMDRVKRVTSVVDGVPVASWNIWICRGFRGFGPLAERGHPLRY